MTALLDFNYWLLLRLVAAALCGGIIGLERGWSNHAAGLRTHMIVCLGASGVMLLSELMVAKYSIPGEVLRMGAQVISGVGFLGVGSIIVDGNKVRGVTTAAGLWTTACIGLVVGAGYYLIAGVMLALMMFAMRSLRSVVKKMQQCGATVKIIMVRTVGLQTLLAALQTDIIRTQVQEIHNTEESYEVLLELHFPRRMGIHDALIRIADLNGVQAVECQ